MLQDDAKAGGIAAGLTKELDIKEEQMKDRDDEIAASMLEK